MCGVMTAIATAAARTIPRRTAVEQSSPLNHTASSTPTNGTMAWYLDNRDSPARTPTANHQRTEAGARNARMTHQTTALMVSISTVLWLNK
jgi:hypothetical protein